LLIDVLPASRRRARLRRKKVSNEEWISANDPFSWIVKMKDGRTHMGYGAEHVIDLESEAILSATVDSHGRRFADIAGELTDLADATDAK
jgi:hypothetical protein